MFTDLNKNDTVDVNNFFDIQKLCLHSDMVEEKNFIDSNMKDVNFFDSLKTGATNSSHASSAYNNSWAKVYRTTTLEISEAAVGQYVVYPTHGVGKITEEVSEVIAGHDLKCYKVEFSRKNIIVLVPTNKAKTARLRNLISTKDVTSVYNTLKEPAKNLRVIWNRRAKEYESRIQSGCIFENVEIVRDLYKNINNPNKSYTESIIYDEALSRIVLELSVVLELDYQKVEDEVNDILDKYHEAFQSSFDTEDEVSDDDDDDDTEEVEEESLENSEEEDEDES